MSDEEGTLGPREAEPIEAKGTEQGMMGEVCN